LLAVLARGLLKDPSTVTKLRRLQLSQQPTSWNIHQINQLRAQARAWRIGTAVIIFGITGFCLTLLYNAATKLTRAGAERDQFVTEFKNGLATQVAPQAQQLAKRTWSEIVPAVQAEVVKLQSRYPELADGVEHELERLSVNLPVRAEKALRDTVGQMITQREQTIRQLYGDITPEQVQRVQTAFLAEGERRAGSIADFLATPFEDTVHRIMADLDAIEASAGDDVNSAQAAQQLTTLLAQLTEEQLKSTAADLNKAIQEQKLTAEAK